MEDWQDVSAVGLVTAGVFGIAFTFLTTIKGCVVDDNERIIAEAKIQSEERIAVAQAEAEKAKAYAALGDRVLVIQEKPEE